MEYKTRVNLAGVELKNPVMVASGTFGSGKEYSEFYDLGLLGAITVKGVANAPWAGNATPRIAETHSGMINAIGLQNPGVDVLIKRDLPFLKKYDTKVIVNVCGKSVYDYLEVVEKLNDQPVDLLEINISCPNVKQGGIAFGQAPNMAAHITQEIRKKSNKPVIIKLSPNVTNIAEMAKAVEAAGADGITMINTLVGMRFDLKTGKPIIANKTGGYSGPAIFPVALRMVYQVSQAVSIPVIGMGGIASGRDAIEMMIAGASAIAVGCQNLVDPYACPQIIQEMNDILDDMGITDIHDIIGKSHQYEDAK